MAGYSTLKLNCYTLEASPYSTDLNSPYVTLGAYAYGATSIQSANTTITGATSITNTTDSTSTTTGALTVSGGVGIKKNLSVEGNLSVGGQINVDSPDLLIGRDSILVTEGERNVYLSSISYTPGVSGTRTVNYTINGSYSEATTAEGISRNIPVGIYINGKLQTSVTIRATSYRINPSSSTIVWSVTSSSGTFSYNFSAGTTYTAICSATSAYYSDLSSIYVTLPTSLSSGSIGIGCEKITSGQTIIGVKEPYSSYPIQIGAEGYAYAQIASRTSGWTTVSDMRDKVDFRNIDNALLFINHLRPVRYLNNEREKYMDINGNIDSDLYNRAIYRGKRRQVGFIAQEVYESMKEIYNNDNYADIVDYSNYQISEEIDMNFDRYSIRYTSLIPFLTGAIQELSKKIETLEATIEELKSQ